MKFEIGEIVNHKNIIGTILIIACGQLESKDAFGEKTVEIFYRCRDAFGRIQDFLEFELERRK